MALLGTTATVVTPMSANAPAPLHWGEALAMDVSRVLDLVRPFFENRKEPYAIVGGLALLADGAPRATFDVDLLAPRRTRDDLDRLGGQ